MKTILTSFLILAAGPFMADGSMTPEWRYQQLYDAADLVVIAKPLSTKDTTEQTVLIPLGNAPAIHVVGLSSEFAITSVMKGGNGLTNLVLHHYRLADTEKRVAPNLASFDPTQSTHFVLFLLREPDGRYAPVGRPTDPMAISILSLNTVKWDEIESNGLKNWPEFENWLQANWPRPPHPDFSADGVLR